jgi:histidinol-phosphatase
MNPDWRSRYEQAIDIVRRAGQVALRYFDTDLEVEWKGDLSPVTVADRATEQFLRTALSEAFPGDGFLGEEHGATPGSTGYRWIIDPIDGTRSFVRGIPVWAVLVGLEHHGQLIAGIVDAPVFRQTYHALLGNGCYRDQTRIQVSNETDLSRALVFYSSLSWFVKAGREQEFLQLVRRTERQRGFGDWYGFLLVAQGSGEVMVEHGVHVWDVAAIKPIVEEAGGRFSNWDGGQDIHKPDVVVSNSKLHGEVLAILAGDTGR